MRNAEALADDRVVRRLTAAGLVLAGATHLLAVFHKNINWDEFYFLSFVYDYANGRLAGSLQTFHVHLFTWLTRVPGDEVDQLIVARASYLLLLTGTCVSVYWLARAIASREGALFAALCCAGYSNVLEYGTSFRADGLSAFLLTASMALAASSHGPRAWLLLPALGAALALVITIKSILLLPLVVIAATAAAADGRDARTRVAILGGVIGVIAVGLYFWHRLAVQSMSGDAVRLQAAAVKVFDVGTSGPGLHYVVRSMLRNPVQWLMLMWALPLTSNPDRISAGMRLWMAAALVSLLTLLVYRNSFPYFFVFLMPPALVCCARSFDRLRRLASRDRAWTRFGLAAAPCVIAVSILPITRGLWRDGVAVQRETIAGVHEIFPAAVPYIDRNGMVASFPKVGFFMSTWGMENYRATDRPVFRDLLQSTRPQFVLTNGPALEDALKPNAIAATRLLHADRQTLRDQFVRFWGPVYVAGHEFRLTAGRAVQWEPLIRGGYRIDGASPVWLNGARVLPGNVVQVSGPIEIVSSSDQVLALRTADARATARAAPDGPLYEGF